MIWIFRVNNVYWGNIREVNQYYKFDIEDTNFDITQYDFDLYFPTADYYLLNESDNKEIYNLMFVAQNANPDRIAVPKDYEIYNIIRDFYLIKSKQVQLS